MKQVMIFISVDLPAPFGPSSPTIPLLIVSVTSLRASCSPYCLVIWLISMDICVGFETAKIGKNLKGEEIPFQGMEFVIFFVSCGG